MWNHASEERRVRYHQYHVFKLRTLIRTFSPRLVGLKSSQAGVRGRWEGAWEHFGTHLLVLILWRGPFDDVSERFR